MRYGEEGRVYQGSEFVGSRQFLNPSEVAELRAFLRTLRSREQTYDELTADQNNFRLAQASVHRFTSNASRTITGFIMLDLDSQFRLIENVGGQNIVLANEDAGSSPENQIFTHTSANLTLNPRECVFIFYDRTSSCVRTVGHIV